MIEDGTILHNQISFDSVPRSVWGHLAEEVKGKDPENVAEEDEEPVQAATPAKVNRPAAAPRSTEAELTRQTGDAECYRIYFNSIGWRILAAFTVLIIIYVALTKLPRKRLVFLFIKSRPLLERGSELTTGSQKSGCASGPSTARTTGRRCILAYMSCSVSSASFSTAFPSGKAPPITIPFGNGS